MGWECLLPAKVDQMLGLVFRYLLIRINPNHSKPHMFAGMKDLFWVIPIGAKQEIDYAQCGWVVASGHSETWCS
jgi:hypothetical protein